MGVEEIDVRRSAVFKDCRALSGNFIFMEFVRQPDTDKQRQLLSLFPLTFQLLLPVGLMCPLALSSDDSYENETKIRC